ncbi:unnamed protein product [Linum tenue]|uniref:Uncharacterized protein n=1 Tax=Linum tenue TaxID=586396 RepID=A0AAV0LK80_9ROSI|nr:unnamed protein product [Linum tenue]
MEEREKRTSLFLSLFYLPFSLPTPFSISKSPFFSCSSFFFSNNRQRKIAAFQFKSDDAPNSSSLKLLLPSVLSFHGLTIDDAPYCQRGDRFSHEFYHGGSGW